MNRLPFALKELMQEKMSQYKMTEHADCFLGHELVDEIVNYLQLPNRNEAEVIGQLLLDKGVIVPHGSWIDR